VVVEHSKKEILERVLLLMKYDNSQTLSENYSKININEQYSATNEKLWQMVNSGDESSIKSYACELSRMTFTQLSSLFKQMTPKYGVITPDLIGYGFGTPTIASTILENEIYLRRLKNKDSFEKIMIPLKSIINVPSLGQQASSTSNTIGKEPELPESTLLSNKMIQGKGVTSSVSYYAAKSATLICGQGVVPASPATKKKTQQELKKEERNYFKTEIFDFSSLPKYDLKKIDPNNPKCGPWYEEGEWTEPKTNITIDLKCESPSSILTKLIDKYKEKGKEEEEKRKEEEEKSLVTNKDNIINNKILQRVFSKDKLQTFLQDEDCKLQYLKFFQGIVDGSVKNKNGRVVGKAYKNSKGQLYYAKWNEPTPPCTDEWWDKHGWKIQVGAAVVAGILLPGYGWGLVTQILIDASLNVYSLKKALESQDEDRIKLESLYLFLPLVMATRPVRVALEELKFTKSTIDSLSSKISSITPNMTPAQREFILQNLTNEEKRALTMMGTNPKVREVIKNSTKETLDKLKTGAKSAKVSGLRKVSEPLVNLLVYGVPMVGYIAYQIANLDKIAKEKIGRPLNKEEKEFWKIALSMLTEEDASKFTKYIESFSPEEFRKNCTVENGEVSEVIKLKDGYDMEESPKLKDEIIDIYENWLNSLPDRPSDVELLSSPNPDIPLHEPEEEKSDSLKNN
jgi:hypothetical protein